MISVVGKDRVGILARFSTLCAEKGVNIADVNQSILEDYFAMVMLAEIPSGDFDFASFRKMLLDEGEKLKMQVHVMHEDVFTSMHHI